MLHNSPAIPCLHCIGLDMPVSAGIRFGPAGVLSAPGRQTRRKLDFQLDGNGQSGSTMVEVLVTLAIVSIGLLGFAGLLAKSMQYNQSAYNHTQATMLAYDIAERMRANRPAAMNGDYNIALGTSPAGGGLSGTDLSDWKTTVSRALPGGDGSVSVDLAGNVTLVLRWSDKRDGTSTSFTTQTNL